MLIVCPNCATPYGVEMASLRPARGWTRQVRCSRCRCVWQAELSYADRLLLAADAVLPVRRAMAAIAQTAARAAVDAAVDAARSTLPRFRRATRVLAAELETARIAADRAPVPLTDLDTGPTGPERLRTAAFKLIERIGAAAARMVSAIKRQSWWRSRRLSWWRSRRLAWWMSRWLSWRPSWWLSWSLSPRPSLSRLQAVILALALGDAVIISWRADLVWAMPQTASFYAELGLPVNLRGIDFEGLAASAERHDGERVLVVKGEIANSSGRAEEVPHLRFAIRNAEHQEIYSWTAAVSRGRLPAGERLASHSELILPPPDTRDVEVRFIDRENTF